MTADRHPDAASPSRRDARQDASERLRAALERIERGPTTPGSNPESELDLARDVIKCSQEIARAALESAPRDGNAERRAGAPETGGEIEDDPLVQEHVWLRRRVRTHAYRFGIPSNPGWSPSDFDHALSQIEQRAASPSVEDAKAPEAGEEATGLWSAARCPSCDDHGGHGREWSVWAGDVRMAHGLSQHEAFEIAKHVNALTEREHKHLTIHREVEQILGKALGYPWFKDDPKNFPDATEADGVCIGEHVTETIAAEAASRLADLRAKRAIEDAPAMAAEAAGASVFAPKTYPFTLDEYELTNLREALRAVMAWQSGPCPLDVLNSGDWVGQVVSRLDAIQCDYVPNATAAEYREAAKRTPVSGACEAAGAPAVSGGPCGFAVACEECGHVTDVEIACERTASPSPLATPSARRDDADAGREMASPSAPRFVVEQSVDDEEARWFVIDREGGKLEGYPREDRIRAKCYDEQWATQIANALAVAAPSRSDARSLHREGNT